MVGAVPAERAAFNPGVLFYELVFRPARAWDAFAYRRPFFISLTVYLCAAASSAAAFGASGGNFIIIIPLLVLQWAAASGIYHLLSHIAGGKGDAVNFFCLWAFTEIPLIFMPALSFAAPQSFLSVSVLFSGVYLWSVVLKVKLIKFNYHVSALTAVFILLQPFIAAAVLAAASVAFYAVWMFL